MFMFRIAQILGVSVEENTLETWHLTFKVDSNNKHVAIGNADCGKGGNVQSTSH